jgi:hypothetical protein
MKRMKRSHLKRFSAGYINTGQPAMPRGRRPDYGCTSGNVTYVEHRLVVLFGLDKPSRDNSPRVEVLERLKKVLTEADPDRHICLINKKYTKIFMFWSSEYSRFWFVKKVCSAFVKSISYPDREAAMRAYNSGRITWIELSNSQTDTGSPSPRPVSV